MSRQSGSEVLSAGSDLPADNRARRRTGVPIRRSGDVTRRILRNPFGWLSLGMIALAVVCAVGIYLQVVPDREVPGGRLIGLGTEAVPKAAKYAAISLVPLSLLFFLADRWRPQFIWARIMFWITALAWGGFVATWLSLQINSWAASHLAIEGDGDPASGARAAVFVAPFVEEATKATIVFWLAILMRYRFVNRLSGIVLAGLSGAGFAFTENIIYYGRAYRYAAQTFGEADPDQVLQSIFFQRGVVTPFAHPLFTVCTGIGVALALRAKSKTFRVVAPLIGFLAAALLHMLFNGSVTVIEGPLLLVLYGVALLLVGLVIGFIIRQELREGAVVRSRLHDYERAGWVTADEVAGAARLRTRLKSLWHGLWSGPRVWWATVRHQVASTELAYLRDAAMRGLVDEGGTTREAELLDSLRVLRPVAVVNARGRAPYPSLRRRRGSRTPTSYAPPAHPGPAGLGGNWPAPGATPIGGGSQYSKVDPSWKPPS